MLLLLRAQGAWGECAVIVAAAQVVTNVGLQRKLGSLQDADDDSDAIGFAPLPGDDEKQAAD
jgi:hypothetical protein